MTKISAAWLADGAPRRVKAMNPALRAAWRGIVVAVVAACITASVCTGAEVRSLDRLGRRKPPVRPKPSQANESPSVTPGLTSKLEVVPGPGGADTIAMDFYGLDIDHLLRLLSETAQVTITRSDQVTGPVTVIAPQPVSIDVAFQIVNSVLQVRGFTMIRAGTGIYKVVPIADAIQSGLPPHFGADPSLVVPSDDLITQVIPLENLTASDIAAQLEGLLSASALVVPTSTNWLIITDTAANVHTALTIIADLEDQLSGGLQVFPIQYRGAVEMAELVTEIVLSRGGAAGAGRRPAWERRVAARGPQQRGPRQPARPQAQAALAGPEFCYPDERTNKLIVVATPLHLRQIAELISQLDRPVSLRDSYFIYPVQNLMASELAGLIAPLVGAELTVSSTGAAGSGGAAGRSSTAARLRTRPGASVQSSSGRSIGARTVGGQSRTGTADPQSRDSLRVEPLAGVSGVRNAPEALLAAQAPEGGARPAGQPQAPPAERRADAGGEAEAVAAPSVAEAMIAADDNTNILLISAPPEQLDLIQQMLDQLDVLPPQVHIRAIIAEVGLTRDTSLGFSWDQLTSFGPYGDDKVEVDFSTNFDLVETDEGGNPVVPSGILGVIVSEDLSGILTALTTDSKARILSAPSIFTSNNQPARIDVSKRLPFPTGIFQSSVAAETISTSIDYQSVGIVLEVVPRVTQGDMVQMEITISANEPGESAKIAGQDYPSFNQRLATATLTVKAGNTVVLGGLMREQIQRSASKVPLLGDLPLLGTLFRSTTSRRSKSELLLFLTPHVVRTSAESARITDEEKSRLPDIPRSVRGPAARSPLPDFQEWIPPVMEEPLAPEMEEYYVPEVDHLAPPAEVPAAPELGEAPAAEPEEPPAPEAESQPPDEAAEPAPAGAEGATPGEVEGPAQE